MQWMKMMYSTVSKGIITLQTLCCSLLSWRHSSGCAYARPFGGPALTQVEALICLENNPRKNVLRYGSQQRFALAQPRKNEQAQAARAAIRAAV